ncbi:MAG: hypothetical protein JWN00_3649 [Actinomycetia bacterium]|nr:hypothetical protein [Actinomycetes bacterium]
MQKLARMTARAALVAAAAAFVGLGAGVACADTTTNGDQSLLGGNQVIAPISAPIDISGNGVGVGGDVAAVSMGGAHVTNNSAGNLTTSGQESAGGGNQIDAPVGVPINVCGNAVGAVGIAKAVCRGTATVVNKEATVIVVPPAARTAQRVAYPSPPTAVRTPISLLPGVGGDSNPLAQTQLPLLSQNSNPVSLGSPLQSETENGVGSLTNGSAIAHLLGK